jgi:hypothetical protein
MGADEGWQTRAHGRSPGAIDHADITESASRGNHTGRRRQRPCRIPGSRAKQGLSGFSMLKERD